MEPKPPRAQSYLKLTKYGDRRYVTHTFEFFYMSLATGMARNTSNREEKKNNWSCRNEIQMRDFCGCNAFHSFARCTYSTFVRVRDVDVGFGFFGESDSHVDLARA
jgi:hypothetical protein